MTRRYPPNLKRPKTGQVDWRKLAPKTFETPALCVEERNAKIFTTRYGSGERKNERQVLCEACKRWCYSSDRCNLFTTVKQ